MSVPYHARHCLISDNRFAFLALTPKSLPWESPLMGVLKLTPGTYLKQTKRAGLWGLKRAIQEDWCNLERKLCVICQFLEVHILLVSLDTEKVPLPHSYGYLRLHESRELAEQAIQNSIDGFMVLLGYCSYLILRRSGTR